MGSGAQYPWSASRSMEDCREQWCDGKWLPQVQIRRLSLVRVWVTVGTGPQCCNGETFGPPIKGYILYCKRFSQSFFLEELTIESVSSPLPCIVIELSSGSVISSSYLTITSSQLIEHVCNNPQGLTEREREREYCKKEIQRQTVSAELPRRSLAAYAVQQNCVLSPDIIKHSSVDVASTLEVNHVKSKRYVIVFTSYICYSLREICLQ